MRLGDRGRLALGASRRRPIAQDADELVHHELKLLLRRPRDMDLVALLEQPLVRVHHLQRLGRVAGEHQDLAHRTSPSWNRLAVREEEYAWLVVDLPSLIVVPVDYSP